MQPGRDFEETCDRLAADLAAVLNVETGRPLVRSVTRTSDHYPRRPGDHLPDLFIGWNREALVETAWSPKIGIVHVPYTHWRTGDHRPDGLLFARGPGIIGGPARSPIRMMDLAPTLAAGLEVELPDVDGRPVAWLTDSVRCALPS